MGRKLTFTKIWGTEFWLGCTNKKPVFSKNVFFTILGWTGQKMRYWIWGPVGFKPVYLLTYLSYLNSDKCILILIEFPLIWYIMGLSRSKFDRFSRVWRSGKFLSLLGVIFSTDILNIKIELVGKWSILATFFYKIDPN